MADSKADKGDAKTVAETVDVPKGLDVIPTVPGTIVGAHDVQGVDGETRTDRPGEILGTPAETPENVKRRETAADIETARADHVREEVDRANREELPKLGGDAPAENWEPTKR